MKVPRVETQIPAHCFSGGEDSCNILYNLSSLVPLQIYFPIQNTDRRYQYAYKYTSSEIVNLTIIVEEQNMKTYCVLPHDFKFPLFFISLILIQLWFCVFTM